MTARSLLWRGFRRHRRLVLMAFVLRGTHQLGELGVPVLIGVVVDKAVSTGDTSQLVLWLAVLGLDFLVLSYSWRWGSRWEFVALQQEMHLLRCEIAEHVLDDRGADTEQLPGELLSVATSDADRCAHSIWAFGWLSSGLLAIVIAAAVLLTLDLRIGLVTLVGLPVCLGAIQLLTPVVARRAHAEQDVIGKVAALASDLVRGLRPLRGIGAERQAVARYRSLSQDATTARISTATSFGYLFGVSSVVGGLFLALVAGLGGSAVLDGSLDIGELVAIVGVVQFLGEPITLVGEASAEFGRARASAARIAAVLRTPRLLHHGTRVPRGRDGILVVDGLRHGSLHGLTFAVAPGEMLALVVTEPAASDDLVDVLSSEVAPSGGTVLLDGEPLHELTVQAVHERLLVSRHHVDLFEGTLRSNIAIGPGDLDRVLEATAASDVAGLDPLGLEQVVTDRGYTFSGGQRQRIALARSLMTDPATLVLQEPTTAVDALTEQVIAQGLREVRHGDGDPRTTVVLTSSPALLHEADRVVLVVDGAAVAEGTHAALVVSRPDYRDAVLR